MKLELPDTDGRGEIRPIKGWPNHFACEDGTILAIWVHPLAPRKGHGKVPYPKVAMYKPGRRHPSSLSVHKMIAETFHGPSPSSNHEIRHLDGNPQNNAAANLAWGTRKENAADRERHGRTSRGKDHSEAILEGLARNGQPSHGNRSIFKQEVSQ